MLEMIAFTATGGALGIAGGILIGLDMADHTFRRRLRAFGRGSCVECFGTGWLADYWERRRVPCQFCGATGMDEAADDAGIQGESQ